MLYPGASAGSAQAGSADSDDDLDDPDDDAVDADHDLDDPDDDAVDADHVSDAGHNSDAEDDSDEDDSDESSGSEESQGHVTCHTDIVNVMGSVKEKRYQDALAQVQDTMNKNRTVPVRVEYDVGNKKDGNALRVEVWLDDKWKNVGTVQKQKIRKVTYAMQQGTVTGCRIVAKPTYRLNVNKSGMNGLTCQIAITKRGRWSDDDTYYQYHDPL